MEMNAHLYNAAVIGENGSNSNVAFIAEGKKLHAVEQSIADQKVSQSNPALVLPLMRDAWKALLQFAQREIPSQYVDMGQKEISLKEDEKEQLIEKILHTYMHLSHIDRNELSSLVHHKK